MNQKKTNYLNLVTYELRNVCGNPYVHLFGILMPIFFVILFSKIDGSSIPEEAKLNVSTSIFGSTAMLIPLAVALLGCAATSAQEIEKKVPLRFRLFGFKESSIIFARLIAEMILVTVALVIYCVVCCIAIDVKMPVWWALLVWLACFYLLSIICFMLGYGFASIFKKFGLTYCFSMILYFVIISLSGMMGMPMEQLPKPLRMIGGFFPTSYITAGVMDFWDGGSYNFMPMIQSFLLMGGVAGIILYFSVYKARRVLK